MKKRSQAVQGRVDDLYALMATAAAKRAISKIEGWDDPDAAMDWANWAIKLLGMTSAASARYTFTLPKVDR